MMLGKTLGLDISEDTICGVVVKSSLKGRRIAGCAVVAIDSHNGGLAAALARLGEQLRPEAATCISGLYGPHISYRNLTLPFGDSHKVRQTVAFELEALLPFPIEEMLVDFIVTGQSATESQVLAAAVRRFFLAEHLASLAGADLAPEILDIRGVPAVTLLMQQAEVPASGLFIDLDRRQATAILFLEKQVVMVRRLPFSGQVFHEPAGIATPEAQTAIQGLCRAISNTLMAFVDQTDEQRRPAMVFATGSAMLYPGMAELLSRHLELPVKQLDLRASLAIETEVSIGANWEPSLMDNALALALREHGPGTGFNFRREEFSARKPSRFRQEIRHGMMLLAVIIALVMADLAVDYHSLQKRYEALDSRVKAVFSRTLPEVTRIVDPVQQLQAKVNELKKGAGTFGGQVANRRVLTLLEEVSRLVPASLDVVVSRMTIDPDGLQLKGTTDNFNTVDSIKQGLDASTFFRNVTISSANLDRSGRRVLFEIRAQMGD